MMYIGDFLSQATVYLYFTTHKADGTPATLSGSPVISVYKDDGTTETTTGPTLTADFDSRTGLNCVAIATTNAFYVTGHDYKAVITTGTVDSVSVVGYMVGSFSIENRFLNPAVLAAIWAVATRALTDKSGFSLAADQAVNATKWAGQTIPTPAVTGVPVVDLKYILGSILSETSGGYLSAGLKKLLDIASPVFTLASIIQTGDSYARLGAPVGASHSADIASVKTDTGTTIPGKLPSALSAGGMIKADVEEYKATACPTADTAGYPKVTIKVGTGIGEVNLASGKTPATIAAGDIATDAITADALKADAATEIAHALLDHALSAHLTSGTVGESLASYPGKKVVVGNQLIQYAANNTTELFRFNLFAADGSTPTMTDVYYAVRV